MATDDTTKDAAARHDRPPTAEGREDRKRTPLHDRWPGLDDAELWRASVAEMHTRIDGTFGMSRERVVADVRARPEIDART